MSHNRAITSQSPGMILLMVDQSSSMEDGTPAKKDVAATAVNNVLYEIIDANKRGDKIADKCQVFILGYGGTVRPLVTGTPSQLHARPLRLEKVKKTQKDAEGNEFIAEKTMPVWLDADARYDTPMTEAFHKAGELVARWVQANPNNFPPVVINITDGEPNDRATARKAAQSLLEHQTEDGATLLFNVHISANPSGEIIFPTSSSGLNTYGQFLFDISSKLPISFLKLAEQSRLPAVPGARGCVFNGSAETLIKVLNFGSVSFREPSPPRVQVTKP